MTKERADAIIDHIRCAVGWWYHTMPADEEAVEELLKEFARLQAENEQLREQLMQPLDEVAGE